MKHIGIIGAGAAGLSAAFDLIKAGYQVTLYEAEERVGGLAAGFKDESWEWELEKFYHHWFESDHDLLGLAEEMGVREKIFFPRPKTSYWIDGKIYRSEISLSALQLPLSPIGKFRLGLFGAYLKFSRNWQGFERSTAHQWLLKRMGPEVYQKLWEPLLVGKFGKAYQEVNMAWFWARVHSRTLRLGTYVGGFQAFLDELATQIVGKGGQLHLKTRVESITRLENGKLEIATADGTRQQLDAVLSTSSPRLLRKLVPQISGTYAEQLDNLRSIGAVVVILALKHQLLEDGTYWLNLPTTFPFLALVEHTNYLEHEHYGGDHLVYCGDYVAPDHEYFQLSEDDLTQRYIAALPTFNPKFSPDWIRRRWVFRAPYAQPLPTVNHSQNIPAIRTPVDGVYWASMSQVYPWDRGTNYAVEIGRRAAQHIMEDLQ